MEILELITTKDLVVLVIGSLIGYLSSRIVAKQTEKKRGLTLETTGRRIIIESSSSCPFTISDLDGNILENVYMLNVRLWNKGNKHVERKDISKDHPLEIHLCDEAEVLGDPIIFRGNDKVNLNITNKSTNVYGLDFECVNPDEWTEIGFFIKDTSNIKITATGRVYGQDNDFSVSIDDGRVSVFERLTLWGLLLFITLSPLALCWGGWWLLTDYSLTILINDFDSLPENLKQLLAYGFFVPLLAFAAYSQIWMKKRGNPKTYPIDEDFRPSEVKNIGALWGSALSGKNYRVSGSSHNNGEIYTPNQ